MDSIFRPKDIMVEAVNELDLADQVKVVRLILCVVHHLNECHPQMLSIVERLHRLCTDELVSAEDGSGCEYLFSFGRLVEKITRSSFFASAGSSSCSSRLT